MIGNDVVDLVLAEKKVIGDELDIYKKIFTESEQLLIKK
jgi:hypothetical protein